MGILYNLKISKRIQKEVQPIYIDIAKTRIAGSLFNFLWDVEVIFDTHINKTEKILENERKYAKYGDTLSNSFPSCALEMGFLMHYLFKKCINRDAQEFTDQVIVAGYQITIDLWLCSKVKFYIPELRSVESGKLFDQVLNMYGSRADLYDDDRYSTCRLCFCKPLPKEVDPLKLKFHLLENIPQGIEVLYDQMIIYFVGCYGEYSKKWKSQKLK